MANTTNFGWETPDDTDLVKDGALAMRTLGNAIDASLVDLKGGTTGQVLSKNTNTDMDFVWVTQNDSDAIQNSIVDAKGDLISATADNTPARLASSGVNGQVLTIDTSTSTGLKWAAPAAGSFVGCQIHNTAALTIANTTLTELTFNAETLDTDGFHSTSTNTGRITIPTGKNGKYLVSAKVTWASNSTGRRQLLIAKNGSYGPDFLTQPSSSVGTSQQMSVIYDLVATDYLQVYVQQASGGNLNLDGGADNLWFNVIYLGA